MPRNCLVSLAASTSCRRLLLLEKHRRLCEHCRHWWHHHRMRLSGLVPRHFVGCWIPEVGPHTASICCSGMHHSRSTGEYRTLLSKPLLAKGCSEPAACHLCIDVAGVWKRLKVKKMTSAECCLEGTTANAFDTCTGLLIGRQCVP